MLANCMDKSFYYRYRYSIQSIIILSSPDTGNSAEYSTTMLSKDDSNNDNRDVNNEREDPRNEHEIKQTNNDYNDEEVKNDGDAGVASEPEQAPRANIAHLTGRHASGELIDGKILSVLPNVNDLSKIAVQKKANISQTIKTHVPAP